MEQYTLLVMDTNKIVYMHTFLTMKDLLNYKFHSDDRLKNIELKKVDKYGYAWFAELENTVENKEEE